MSDQRITTTETRADQYRDLLEGWAEWWNNVGRHHFGHYLIPPITETGEALSCLACKNVGTYEAEGGPSRCQVCRRRLS